VVQARIDIDSAELSQAIDRLFNALLDTRPAFADLGELGLLTVRGYFDRQEEPDGSPWQALTPAYLAYKQRRRLRTNILQKRGVLFKSITYEATSRDVVVGSNLVYARIHQFGGDIQRQASRRTMNFKVDKRTGRSRFARQSKANFQQDANVGAYTISIPARPYLSLGDDPAFVQAAQATLEDHIRGAWDG